MPFSVTYFSLFKLINDFVLLILIYLNGNVISSSLRLFKNNIY